MRCCDVALAGSYSTAGLGNALWQEYCDLLGRDVWGTATTCRNGNRYWQRWRNATRWVTVYYGWRPNLPDEVDNHLIDPALAGGAAGVVTHNVRIGSGRIAF